jgi:hypothetical protein
MEQVNIKNPWVSTSLLEGNGLPFAMQVLAASPLVGSKCIKRRGYCSSYLYDVNLYPLWNIAVTTKISVFCENLDLVLML